MNSPSCPRPFTGVVGLTVLWVCTFHLLCSVSFARAQELVRTRRFDAASAREARTWQGETRERLWTLLAGGKRPAIPAPDAQVLRREVVSRGGYVLEELSLKTLDDRRAHVWVAIPARRVGTLPAVLTIHGHGGTGEQIVRGQGLYWYGRALIEMGYVVVAPDVGSHELQHKQWTLMGERVWDCLRALDYVETRDEVDRKRLAVAGLSLGGETAMYVAALDERIQVACCSGWLTTVANMENGHCDCWQVPGFKQEFDFADVYACVAPRPIVFEIGQRERAPGGFPVEAAKTVFEDLSRSYRVFGAAEQATLMIHPDGHVFDGTQFWPRLRGAVGTAHPWPSPTGDANIAPSKPVDTTELLRRGEIGRRARARALGVFDGWWATRDETTGLFPRRLDQPVWAPQDNAADMLPFLFLTAHYLAPERLAELTPILEREQKLTNRMGPLPDWYDIPARRFVYEQPDVHRAIFNAAEYCKDGLLPMTEVMGPGPWLARMRELVDAVWQHAPIESDFGKLPADDTEVNGDLLQTLARLYCTTEDRKYFDWAARLGDAYCSEVLPRNGGLPPHRWDFAAHRPIVDILNLNDHGNELIGGLAELYVVSQKVDPSRAERYRPPLLAMFRRLSERARNEDGLWFAALKASTAEPTNRATPDTWGYPLAAMAAFAAAARDATLAENVRCALARIDQPRYAVWSGADSYADSIEGGLILLNRFPEPTLQSWLEKTLPLFLARQRDDGIVEGWYGDGNYARTALMVGQYYSRGASIVPWRDDVRFGADADANTFRMAIQADKPWRGVVRFDTPRHRLNLHLPVNYPRLNEFPEWYVVEPGATYEISVNGEPSRRVSAESLATGFAIDVAGNQVVEIVVRRQ